METQEKIVKINLLVSDRVVHNLSESIIEIAAAMHKDRDIIIALNTEGPSIEQLTYRVRDNLLHLLESLCEKMPYDPDRIQIETGNLIEDCKGKFALRKGNTIKGWFYGKHLAKIELQSVKKFEYHYGNFVSNSTYPRLLIGSYLYKNYKDKTLQTFRRDPTDPGQAVDLDLDKLMFECADPKVLGQISYFVNHLPLELESGLREHPKTNINAGEDGDAINSNILGWYNRFFCDIVTETFFSGTTFFPTEKITRPLLCKNPFIVHGPRDYLTNLKKLGFKTFHKFWNEEYDHYTGYQRVQKIYKVIDQISTYSNSDLQSTHNEMLPILEHNKKRLLSISDQDIDKFILHNR